MSKFSRNEKYFLLTWALISILLVIYPIFFLAIILRIIGIIGGILALLILFNGKEIKAIVEKKIIKKAFKRRG